jgi:hypothetical protein
MPRDLCRSDEDSRTDDPAHDQHGHVKRAETPDESMRSYAGVARAQVMTVRIMR